MQNTFLGAAKIIRRKGSRLITTTMFDRGIDPLGNFDLQTNACRRDLGDIRFASDTDPTEDSFTSLYLIPEFLGSEFFDVAENYSTIGISLHPNSFGKALEISNNDQRFTIIDWKTGIHRLNEMAQAYPDMEKMPLYSLLCELDSIEQSSESKASLREKVGPPTGFRYDHSL